MADKEQADDTSAPIQVEKLDEVAGGAAVDYFLKIDGIAGESQDDKSPIK